MSTSFPKILGKLDGLKKKPRKVQGIARQKRSKFLWDLLSEQIFYQNIPVGAPPASGWFSKSPGWPLNRGPTVLGSGHFRLTDSLVE